MHVAYQSAPGYVAGLEAIRTSAGHANFPWLGRKQQVLSGYVCIRACLFSVSLTTDSAECVHNASPKVIQASTACYLVVCAICGAAFVIMRMYLA